MQLYVEGVLQDYFPKDSKGVLIELGSVITLPAPNDKETWNKEGIRARVEDSDERSGDVIVIDAVGDFHVVEPERVIVVDRSTSPVFLG